MLFFFVADIYMNYRSNLKAKLQALTDIQRNT